MNLLGNPPPKECSPRAASGTGAGAEGFPRPIRVCFLIDGLSRAGTESQLLALIRALDRSRVEPFLVLLNGEDDLSRSLEPRDHPVLRLGVKSFASRKAFAAVWRFRRFLRENHIDVLQAYFLDSIYFGVPVAKLAGVRKVIRVRNNLGYWLTRKHRVLARIYGRFVDLTLTNSEPGREALIAEGVRPGKIAVLENGIDVARFAGFPPPDTGREIVRIGAVANLRPVKNLDLLIRAAAELIELHPNVRFEIAGEGEQRPELERLIAELNLGEHFLLRGAVADVPGFLASLDIAVLCSRSEGMSNALLEYMAAGRAIVATRVGANERLIRDEIEGLLLSPNEVAALAVALATLLENPQKAAALGAAAQSRAQECFSRDAMRRRFEEFYANVSVGSA